MKKAIVVVLFIGSPVAEEDFNRFFRDDNDERSLAPSKITKENILDLLTIPLK